MNPLIIFDYIFYRIAYFYEHRFDYGQSKELSGIAILTLFEIFNIFAIFNYFELKTEVNGKRYVLILTFAYVVLFVLNYLRYYKIVNYSKLEDRWEDEGTIGRHIKSLFILSYSALSFVLFVKI
jgi:hypothetical protein